MDSGDSHSVSIHESYTLLRVILHWDLAGCDLSVSDEDLC